MILRQYVSYTNCGLPHQVGGVTASKSSLLVADERVFREQFAINVRTRCAAIAIAPEKKTMDINNVVTGEVITGSYDKLVSRPAQRQSARHCPASTCPASSAWAVCPTPRQSGSGSKDTALASGLDACTGFQTVLPAQRAVVVGGGFIGLEMAENLVHLGLQVTLLQRGAQLLSPMDEEMARYVARHVVRNGVELILDADVTEFRQAAHGAIEVLAADSQVYPADLVIMGIGVRPENWLAKNAGLEIGALGGIRVDDQMRTSDPDIFAVGDAVEVRNSITGQWSLVALAGPANRQGRIAADVIAGRDARFRGSQGTAIIGLFGGAAAWTGVSEKTLQRLGDTDYEKIYLFPNSHAGYYPGAQYLALKIIFRKSNARLLGAQVVGLDGVDKRIDTLALAIQLGATVHDLAEAELCYAPQFGSAKSPVNFAGMVAADVLRGDMPLTHWHEMDFGFLLDVRHPEELVVEHVPGAVNIPLDQLRARLDELPSDREILVFCRSGQRAYYSTRILLQNGFKARNIAGGMLSR